MVVVLGYVGSNYVDLIRYFPKNIHNQIRSLKTCIFETQNLNASICYERKCCDNITATEQHFLSTATTFKQQQ